MFDKESAGVHSNHMKEKQLSDRHDTFTKVHLYPKRPLDHKHDLYHAHGVPSHVQVIITTGSSLNVYPRFLSRVS